MATAELKAKISLDRTEFEKGLRAVRRDMAALTSAIGSVAKAAAGVSLALAGIGTAALVKGVANVLELGDSLDELSKRTGVSAGQLMILQEAFKQSGAGADQVGATINKMQKAISGVNEDGEPTNKMFKQLGLNVDALRKMKPTEQFEAIGKAIRNLRNEGERTTAAVGIFGKSGGALLPLMMDPNAMAGAKGAVGGQAGIMDRNAKAFGDVNDAFGTIGLRFQGIFAGIAEKILPSLKKVADFISTIDLTEFGSRIGAAMQSGINILVNAFRTGQLSELVGLALQIGIMKAVDFLISSFRAAFVAVGEIVGQVFAALFDSSTWSGMVQTFVMAANVMAAGLLDAFAPALKSLQDGIQTIFEKIELAAINFRGGLAAIMGNEKEWERIQQKKQDYLKAFNQPKNQAASIGGITVDDLKANAKQSAEKAANALLELSGKNILSPSAVKDAFSKAFAGGGIFGEDIEAAQKQFSELATKLNVPIETVKKAAAAAAQDGKLAAPGGDQFMGGGRQVQAASTLERIGALMGTGGGKAIDLARKTVDNTGKMVQQLTQLVGYYQNGNNRGESVATYA